MKRNTKPLRAEPRRKTPPVAFRTDEGERIILALDETFTTTTTRAHSSSRVPILLSLGAGLRVTLGSRRIAKRRYSHVVIEQDQSETRKA